VYRYVFAVNDDAYCVWEHDLPERNERFLRHLDTGYFAYVAERHVEALDGIENQRAAVALRSEYYHGLEALFSLLGGLAQAPGCVAGWLSKCPTRALMQLVEGLSQGRPVLTQRGRQSVSMGDLSAIVHTHAWQDESPGGATAARFGALWHRFAADFLNESFRQEHNSIKHGFRVAAGGFTLRIGREPSYGVRPPESELHTIGHSPRGTTFYAPEAIPGLPKASKHHFRIRRTSLNWRAEAMAQRLHLLAWSVNNVISELRALNGVDATTVQFQRPEDPDAFEVPWQWNVGVASGDLDYVIGLTDVDPVSQAALRAKLEGRASSSA